MKLSMPTERLFSLSSFEGLRLLRAYETKYPEYGGAELVAFIESVDADAASLDMLSALELHKIVDQLCPLEGPVFFRHCIRAVLVAQQPIWSKLMRHGRKRFLDGLDQNNRDVFHAAGLMEQTPCSETLVWWDETAGYARLITDHIKMAQGREAEILTIEYERATLSSLGIDRQPEWPGLDDNFAGYDVLSFDIRDASIVSKMIEVKSTTASPLRFYITRNEWRQAEKVGDRYIFHVWDMNPETPQLHVRSVDQVAPHIPTNNGKGNWTLAEVPVGIAASQ
ncbi:hypothetical protein AWH62_12720 [Maricaulis sp. W15]|uniref:DUF3883 domain-containing protein n=1 Tax=Maricaulis sp. W15 TaxID=1772333 RepID=UPI00094897E8|nr:DUF3883 domain-containing protein [Maricaulis sp. W15]OLF71403.1 hypothetical protein AWH62_12720 [Maricaulis sp. W15]